MSKALHTFGIVEILLKDSNDSALIPLPGKPTIRYLDAFAPNAKLRLLVVQAGALAHPAVEQARQLYDVTAELLAQLGREALASAARACRGPRLLSKQACAAQR